ncbi:MAG: glycosyltransferase [Actinomycetia bacterium]|nr:glycosyltransferase [Actinomycetes bacterium]MCP4961213.1 glycosyltransferase [Actinomycetes bacterium]
MSTTTRTRAVAPTDHTASRWDQPVLARSVASVAILATTGYLVWRFTSTRGATPLWLFAPLLGIEIWTFARLALDAIVLWTVPPSERADIGSLQSVDIFVTTFHEPEHLVRATLLGCRALGYPHSTVLIDDAGRDEMVALAEEFGVQYLHRNDTDGARAGALNHALAQSEADLVLVLEADQVPLPDALHAVTGYFHDPKIAVVQTPMEYLNHDSVLHSSDGRHERGFANEVLGPARNHMGGALWEGSASLIRRVAFATVGGIATDSTTGELQTTMRLQAAGWSTKYHAEPIVQGLAPHNLSAFLRQRERWARGHLGVLRTDDDPIRKRGLTVRQRVCFSHLLLDYLQAPIDLALVTLLGIVLWTGEAPLNASLVGIATIWLPAFALRSLAAVALSRGRIGFGETAARRMLTLEIHLKALGAAVSRRSGRFEPVARTGVDEGGLDVIEHLRLLTALTLVLETILAARMLDALIGWPLESMRGLALIASSLTGATVLWIALQVLGVFVRRRQHRSQYRVDVDLGAYANGRLVKISDLTPDGAGFVSTESFAPGTKLSLRFRLADASGGATDLELRAVVRNQLPNQTRSRFRIGCRFVGVSNDERDLITEFTSVVRPYQLLRG